MRPLIAIMEARTTIRRRLSKSEGQMTTFAGPVLSSIVMNNALRGAGLLTDENKARRHQPTAFAGIHGVAAGDDVALLEIPPKECDGVLAERRADVAVVFDKVIAARHLPELD